MLEGDRWESDGFQWWQQVYLLSQEGFATDSILSVSIQIDAKDSSKRSIVMDQPNFGLDREFLVRGPDDPNVKHYFDFMRSTANLMGAEQTDETDDELKDALLFEIELARLSGKGIEIMYLKEGKVQLKLFLDAQEDRRNDTALYNPFVLEEIEIREGHPPSWVDFVNDLIEENNIQTSEVVILRNIKYLREMAPIIARADARTVSNYLMWRAIMSKMPDLNAEAGEVRETFNRKVFGIASDPPRWKKCVGEVGFESYGDNNLRVVAGSMYVREYFVPEAKDEMVDMIGNIKAAFRRTLEEVGWMDEVTRARALNKLREMKDFIAYPDELTNEALGSLNK